MPTSDVSAEFALGTFSIAGGEPFGALVIDGRAIALDALREPGGRNGNSVLAVLSEWDEAFPELRRWADAIRGDKVSERVSGLLTPIEGLRAHPPVNLPRQFFCTGANYRGHVGGMIRGDPSMRPQGSDGEDPEELARKIEAQLNERAKTSTPFCFIKLPTCMVGGQDDVILPRDVEKPDWELELAVIIGRPARRVKAADAMEHVAGYAILNDVTARELLRSGPMGADWLACKSHPTFAPFGPLFVPAAFVPDPYDLKIRLAVNGKVMQDESTSDMLIDIARQIEWLSRLVNLMPGDVIATGSPAGNGSMHGVFLKPGDIMEGSITGLGVQRTRCVAES